MKLVAKIDDLWGLNYYSEDPHTRQNYRLKDIFSLGRAWGCKVTGRDLVKYLKSPHAKDVNYVELPNLVRQEEAVIDVLGGSAELDRRYRDEHDGRIYIKVETQSYSDESSGVIVTSTLESMETGCYGYFTLDEKSKEISLFAGRGVFPYWHYENENNRGYSCSESVWASFAIKMVYKDGRIITPEKICSRRSWRRISP